jgi:2-polyprenyl-3-methyl-5-hydroxy-6-metoxy-1,4-benzoquinol methylase
MKARESGMPEEEYWASFFNAEILVARILGNGKTEGNILEFGCGYGTFTIPAALHTKGIVTALDIEPEMVRCVATKAINLKIPNIHTKILDFVRGGNRSCRQITDTRPDLQFAAS